MTDTKASVSVSGAWFFVACVLLVALWAVIFLLRDIDTGRLIIK